MSLKRLRVFLSHEELDEDSVERPAITGCKPSDSQAVQIYNKTNVPCSASFSGFSRVFDSKLCIPKAVFTDRKKYCRRE